MPNRDKRDHWSRTCTQKFIDDNMKPTIVPEPDLRCIVLHCKQKPKHVLKYIMFQTITRFKADLENTDKSHWHHDRCIPYNPGIHIPRLSYRTHTPNTHLETNHNRRQKTQPSSPQHNNLRFSITDAQRKNTARASIHH